MGNRSKLGSWSQQQPRSDHHALEGVRTHGRETALHSRPPARWCAAERAVQALRHRSEEHTSELQSQSNLVCRLLLEKKKKNDNRLVPMSDIQRLRMRAV